MGFFSGLFSAATAEPIEAIGNVLDNLFTSSEEKLTLDIAKQRLAHKPALVQAEIMKVQAQHRSTFVAGARPFLLWVCGLGFLFSFVINPIITWINPDVGAPQLPLEVMMELTVAILGLSGLRTMEKLAGKAK